MSINKVILIGNVGKDPEVKHFENDASVANFTLATSETYTNKAGEKITNTEWHNIVCWRGLAKLAENYIQKGKQLYIEGKLRTRSYDAQDGSKKYITEIYADVIQFLGRKESAAPMSQPTATTTTANQPQAKPNMMEPTVDEGDDLPF